jgi:hypothetical protein
VAGDGDVVAVAGPALAGEDPAARVSLHDDLGVYGGGGSFPVAVIDWSCTGITVHDPRVVAVVRGGSHCAGRHPYRVMDDAVHCGLGGAQQRASARAVRLARK